MRTDAKIGFAIGGVLLAVLTVYAIVVPRHSKKTTANTVTLVNPAGTSGSSSTTDTPTTAAPPIAAAGSTDVQPPVVIPVKDPTAAGTSGGTAPTGPIVDSNPTGTQGDGFHPLVPKTDDVKPPKLVGDVFNPKNRDNHEGPANGKHVAPLLPDEGDVAAVTDHDYVIKPGQTLSKIAYEVYGNSRFWVVIQRENKGLDSNHLKVGSTIKLPDISAVVPGPVTVSREEVMPLREQSTPRSIRQLPTRPEITDAHSYVVKSGDNLYGIAKKVLGSGRKAEALYSMNKLLIGPDKSKLKLGMVLKLPDATTTAMASGPVVR